jgi:hypothetical protein
MAGADYYYVEMFCEKQSFNSRESRTLPPFSADSAVQAFDREER